MHDRTGNLKKRKKKQPQLPKPLKYVPGAIPGKRLNQKTFQFRKEKENKRSIVLKENLTVTGKLKEKTLDKV